MLRIARPVVVVPSNARPQFKLLLQRVQDIHLNLTLEATEHDSFGELANGGDRLSSYATRKGESRDNPYSDLPDDVVDYYIAETDGRRNSRASGMCNIF
jgi:hypothetical protein